MPEKTIPTAADNAEQDRAIVRTTDLRMETGTIEVDSTERGTEHAAFDAWLYRIVKGSFGTLTMAGLKPYRALLREVFETITYERDESRYFSSRYDRALVEANIRKAFAEKRSFRTKEELIPHEARLLTMTASQETIFTEKPSEYYPRQKAVENIILDDQGKLKMIKADSEMIALAESGGYLEIAKQIKAKYYIHPGKDRSFHYLPYHTDSSFEQRFLRDVLSLPQLEQLGLEVYYNGDRAMTEFKIKCYKTDGSRWQNIGMYTPDFLILQRRDGKIHKVIIVETKGEIYANDPKFKEKRRFMETEFLRQNNKQFGYARFEYLYLEDTIPENDRIVEAQEKIEEFFQSNN